MNDSEKEDERSEEIEGLNRYAIAQYLKEACHVTVMVRGHWAREPLIDTELATERQRVA
jgi:hypothetical protein